MCVCACARAHASVRELRHQRRRDGGRQSVHVRGKRRNQRLSKGQVDRVGNAGSARSRARPKCLAADSCRRPSSSLTSSGLRTYLTMMPSLVFQLYSIMEMKPPISKAKMTAITRNAIKAIKLYKHVVQCVEKFIQKVSLIAVYIGVVTLNQNVVFLYF